MKFNSNASAKNQIQNFEGGTSYTFKDTNPKLHLYQLTASCFYNEPTFYGEQGDTERQITQVAQSIEDMYFVPKLAVYCREQMYLRTTPVVLMTEAIIKWGRATNKTGLIPYMNRVLLRVDDMIEMFAYWKQRTGIHTLPIIMKKVFKKKIEEAGEYKLAKYSSPRSEFKLKDIIIMAHPRGDYKKIIENELRNTQTWEANISVKGTSKESWTEILPKMQPLAFLRNLRNLERNGIEDLESWISKKLTPENIVRAKIFPFQILSAYKAVSTTGVKEMLEGLMPYTYQNLPKIDGYTAVFSDVSGSMNLPLSAKSQMTYKEVAILSGLLGSRIFSSSIFGIFASEFGMVPYGPNDNILEKSRALLNNNLGGGTEAWKCIQYLLDTRTKVDRIVIFTDCITYNTEGYYGREVADLLKEYRRKINNDCIFYNVDLSKYGMPMVNEGSNNYFINGWSDKIFQYLGIIENMGRQDIDKLITEAVTKKD